MQIYSRLTVRMDQMTPSSRQLRNVKGEKNLSPEYQLNIDNCCLSIIEAQFDT